MSRFDSSFKSSASRDPRAMLYLAGRLPLEGPERIVPFERELIAPQKIADWVFEVVPESGPPRFEHLEALAAWHTREIVAIRRRVSVLTAMEELEGKRLDVTIVLLKPDGVPKDLPGAFVGDWIGARLTIQPSFRKLWEYDGDEVAALDRPALLPWVTLMRTSAGPLERVGARIAGLEDEDLESQFVTLGSAYRNEDYLRQLLGRFGNMLTPKVAAEFPFGKKIMDIGVELGFSRGREEGLSRGREEGLSRGLEQGLCIGREEGKRAAALELLRGIVANRFPNLLPRVDPASLDHVADLVALASRIAVAPDESAVTDLLSESIH